MTCSYALPFVLQEYIIKVEETYTRKAIESKKFTGVALASEISLTQVSSKQPDNISSMNRRNRYLGEVFKTQLCCPTRCFFLFFFT